MPRNNSIFICVDHTGYSGMKLLQFQFNKIGIDTDMILFALFKSDKCLALSNLSCVEFEALKMICSEHESIQQLTPSNYQSALFSLQDVREIQALLQAQNAAFNLITTEGIFSNTVT